jgi:hypothetical protein
MSRFYKRREAADLAAAELEPHDADRRRAIASNLFEELYDALNDGRLVGRNPENLRQILPGSLLAAIAFGGCLIAATDLNSWLSASGFAVSLPVDEAMPVPYGRPSDEQVLVEVEKIKKAKGGGRSNHNKQVAVKFGLTVSQVKNQCKKAKAAREKAVRLASTPYYQNTLSRNLDR